MEIKDILALANAGFTAEQINQLNNQAQPQVQPRVFPQAQPQVQPQVFPQTQPQMVQPQVQPQMVQPQMVQPQMVQPQTVQPQVQPQTVQPQVQPQMIQPQVVQPQVQMNPYGVPFMGQLTPAPMPPVPATNPDVAKQTTEGAAPIVPGNPSPEQLAGQLAQAQATNLNGVTVSPAQKVSLEEKLQDHYRALMGVSEDKKGE